MEQTKGNPKNEPKNAPDNKGQGSNLGSSEAFFSQLESEVNGSIDDSLLDAVDDSVINAYDSNPQNETRNEPPVQQPDPARATPPAMKGTSNSIDWEKRYKDSSKEALRLSSKVKEFNQFEPLLNVMRKDKGLVTHIKDYLEAGGAPEKSLKEELKLPEDFIYDPNEAVNDKDSDSAKVFNAQVNKAVESKVGEITGEQKRLAQMQQAKLKAMELAKQFQVKHKIPGAEMKELLQEAAKKKLSLDDTYYLRNRENAGRNMATNVRKDVMNQMQNARNIPQSASHSNSARVEKDPVDDLFDTLKGSDEADNLFG